MFSSHNLGGLELKHQAPFGSVVENIRRVNLNTSSCTSEIQNSTNKNFEDKELIE